jgi:hypothetical protein
MFNFATVPFHIPVGQAGVIRVSKLRPYHVALEFKEWHFPQGQPGNLEDLESHGIA